MIFHSLSQTVPDTDRYTTQIGYRLHIQVPESHAEALLAALTSVDPLSWGGYEAVSYTYAPGTQSFRSTGLGRNVATRAVVTVPCVEIAVFIVSGQTDRDRLEAVLRSVYDAHPYEEPVIVIQPALRCLHRPGIDEDNPNRFWNGATPEWVPPEHR